jgi:hypothetical protein
MEKIALGMLERMHYEFTCLTDIKMPCSWMGWTHGARAREL